MNAYQTEIRLRGRNINVPSIQVCGRTIIANGKWVKLASVHDEAFVEGEVVPDPEIFKTHLQKWDARPDIFTFSQKISDAEPKFTYFMEWDNFAVIRVAAYEDWLKKIKKDVKENLRRAKREGIDARTSPYDDKFVRGIKDIYDETLIRQGMRCWHYGKSLDEIRKVHETYCSRAEYIGAYLGDELVGFLKMVYTGDTAKTMHVISKERYFQKRPANALIAKAVEVCAQKGMSYFIYGEAKYPGKKTSSLADFKRRNGFDEIRYPRYFVPLTAKGKLALRLGLHCGLKRKVPPSIIQLFLTVRAKWHSWSFPRSSPVRDLEKAVDANHQTS